MTELRTLVSTVSEAVEHAFAECGEVSPLYHVFAGDELMLMPAPRLPNKDLAVAVMKMTFQEMKVTKYVFTNEAWMLIQDHDAKRPRNIAGANRQHPHGLKDAPGRIEAVMFVAEDEQRMLMAHRKIERPENAKPFLGPLIFDNGGVMEGRMVGLLPNLPSTNSRMHQS
jgi:hypothetical protein